MGVRVILMPGIHPSGKVEHSRGNRWTIGEHDHLTVLDVNGGTLASHRQGTWAYVYSYDADADAEEQAEKDQKISDAIQREGMLEKWQGKPPVGKVKKRNGDQIRTHPNAGM